MKKIFILTALFGCVVLTPAQAQENWTEIGIYGFLVDIQGPVKKGRVGGDIDISLSDIDNALSMAFMGFVDHRRGRWSFIVDVAYLNVSKDKHKSLTPITSSTLDIKAYQIMSEGFIGYRVLEQDYGANKFGLDLLGGARYNKLELKFDLDVSLPRRTLSSDRKLKKTWWDGVVALRVQYEYKGWGVGLWADYGNGSNTSSYQLFGILSYRFKNNIRVFGGYRQYSYKIYGNDSAGIRYKADLDYKGPQIGVSYRF